MASHSGGEKKKKAIYGSNNAEFPLTRTYVSINVTECPNPRKHIETKLVILDQPTKN